MSQYVQLLGTDTPNSFGGCCYYGPIDHPALDVSTAFRNPDPMGHPRSGAHHVACGQGSALSATEAAWRDVIAKGKAAGSPAGMPTAPADGAPSLSHAAGEGCGVAKSDGYLFFNCPEGTQRFSSEANIKLTKVRGFFFTRWAAHASVAEPHLGSATDATKEEAVVRCPHGGTLLSPPRVEEGSGSGVMGLPGLLFTINDAGVRQANLFGPSTSLRATRCLRTHLAREEAAPSWCVCEDEATAAAARASRACFARLHGPHGALYPPAHVRGNERTSADVSDGARCCCSGGLERFLHVLRGSYFFHRQMVFRLLTPVFLGEGQSVPPRASQERQERRVPDEAEAACVPPQDEVFPLVTPSLSPSRPLSFSSDAPSSAFQLIAMLPLTPSSALLAFRTSALPPRGQLQGDPAMGHSPRRPPLLADTSGDVFGYAVVHAPPPAFDAAKAKALGVRPGPKYTLLKRGIPVHADAGDGATGTRNPSHRRQAKATPAKPTGEKTDSAECGESSGEGKRQRTEEETSAGGGNSCRVPNAQASEEAANASSASPAPRLVFPHEVSRSTASSRETFVSFILDSNTAEDARAAVEGLFMPSSSSVSPSSGPPSSSIDGQVEEDERCGGHSVFEQALQSHADALLLYQEHETGQTGELVTIRRRRRIVLQQVVHVQPQTYFLEFAEQHSIPTDTAADLNEVYRRYVAFVFAAVSASGAVALSMDPTLSFVTALDEEQEDGREERGTRPAKGMDSDAHATATTVHLFTSHVQRGFTAFPTALAHRYHLNRIAPHCFPVGVSTDGEDARGEGDRGPLFWPYSLKFRCIRESSDGPAHSNSRKASGHPHSAAAAASTRLLPWALRGHVAPEGATAPFIRYPTPSAAVAMLSDAFLARLPRPASLDDAPTSTRERGEAALPRLSKPLTSAAETEREDDGGGALVFTGTGSAVPSKYRNVSGTLLEVHAPAACFARKTAGTVDAMHAAICRGVFVLDFGEGSLGQLHELFRGRQAHAQSDARRRERGRESESGMDPVNAGLASYVLDMELVFLSHGHADHHLGLLSLLSLRHRCLHHEKERQSKPRQHGERTALQDDDADEPCGERGPCPAAPHRALDKKLLVVLPAEVFSFLLHSWFTASPYRDWVFDECEFDILLPANAAAPPHDTPAEEDAEEYGFTSQAEGKEDDGGLSTASVKTSLPSLGFPRLRSLCREWNDSIHAATRGADDGSQGQPNARVLWDADVFTVDHPANAHGFLLRFPVWTPPPERASGDAAAVGRRRMDSRVFLFSGDTRPSDTLVERCRAFCDRSRGACGTASAREGPFICLHEATFGPGYEADAVRKRHSTLPEALSIGERTRSSFVVLNHFSQRYPKLPGLTEAHLDGSTVDLQCKATARRPPPPPLQAAVDSFDERREDKRSVLESMPVGGNELASNHGGEGADSASLAPREGSGGGPHPSPTSYPSRAVSQRMCFGFDLMRLPFYAVQEGSVAGLLPTFVRLLEEYESWGVGTTQRLRE